LHFFCHDKTSEDIILLGIVLIDSAKNLPEHMEKQF